MLALRWKHVDWNKFRIHVVSKFVRGRFWRTEVSRLKEACGAAFACMGLLKNWRETTAYAGDEDFSVASDRLQGKHPRVPNMLVEDHLRPAAKQVIEIAPGQVWLPQSQACSNVVLGEIGTDARQFRTCCVGQTLQSCSRTMRTRRGRSDGGSGKDDEAMSERGNRSKAHPVGVGDRPWVILPGFWRHCSANIFRLMVARDGVEPPTPAFSGLRSTT